MKILSLSTALLFALEAFFCSQRAFAQTERNIALKQIPLPGIKKTSLSINANIYTYARNSHKGIRITIIIKNDSSNGILLENPLYGIRLNMLDGKGFDVVFPNRNFAPIHSQKHESEIPKSFTINNLKVNSKVLPDTERYQPNILIPVNGIIELDINLDRVLRPDADKPYNYDKTVVLLNGDYKLKISQRIYIDKNKYFSLFGGDFINIQVESQAQ